MIITAKQKKMINIFILIIVYRVLLDWSYYYVISPLYQYMKLITDTSAIRMVESYLLTMFAIIVTPKDENRISSVFLNIQLLVVLIPMLSLYGLAYDTRVFIYVVCLCHFIQCVIFKIPTLKSVNHFATKHYKLITSMVLILFISITVILILIKYDIPTLKAFNLNSVYEIRKENVVGFPLSYLVPWMARIILPFVTLFGLKSRKYLLSAAAVIIQLFIYLVFAQKYYLFAIFMAIGIYYLKNCKILLKGFYIGFPALVLSTTSIYLLDNRFIMLPSLFVRRVLFTPANLKYNYYEFFSNNKKVYFADGTIGKLLNLSSPYDKKIPYIISEYIGMPDSACNTGYWGDAYANLGILGVVILSIFLALIILYAENKTKRCDSALVIACFSLPFYSLNDSALLTMLLTGGLLFLILIFILLDMKETRYHSKSINNGAIHET